MPDQRPAAVEAATPGALQAENATLRAENAALREQVRHLEAGAQALEERVHVLEEQVAGAVTRLAELETAGAAAAAVRFVGPHAPRRADQATPGPRSRTQPGSPRGSADGLRKPCV
jgi:cell division septum initiation protein DivIVA